MSKKCAQLVVLYDYELVQIKTNRNRRSLCTNYDNNDVLLHEIEKLFQFSRYLSSVLNWTCSHFWLQIPTKGLKIEAILRILLINFFFFYKFKYCLTWNISKTLIGLNRKIWNNYFPLGNFTYKSWKTICQTILNLIVTAKWYEKSACY